MSPPQFAHFVTISRALGFESRLIAPRYPGRARSGRCRRAADSLATGAARSRRSVDVVPRRDGRGPRGPRARFRSHPCAQRRSSRTTPRAAVAREYRLPLVETYHTYFEHYLHHYLPALPTGIARGLARHVTVSQCRDVDLLISPSRAMADALRAYGVGSRIEVLPTGLAPGPVHNQAMGKPFGFATGSRLGDRLRSSSGASPSRRTSSF